MKYTTEIISYFRLSSDKNLRRTWLSKIKRQDLPANHDSIRVCHVHFEEDQFQRNLQTCFFFVCPLKFCLHLFHSMVLMYGNK